MAFLLVSLGNRARIILAKHSISFAYKNLDQDPFSSRVDILLLSYNAVCSILSKAILITELAEPAQTFSVQAWLLSV